MDASYSFTTSQLVVFNRLTLAAFAPTLPVCADIKGAIPTAVTSLLDESSGIMPSKKAIITMKDAMSKCRTVMHKAEITITLAP